MPYAYYRNVYVVRRVCVCCTCSMLSTWFVHGLDYIKNICGLYDDKYYWTFDRNNWSFDNKYKL